VHTRTGIFYCEESGEFYHFLEKQEQVFLEKVDSKTNSIDFLLDDTYPIWLLRHSLGKDTGPEDYSQISEEDYLYGGRNHVLGLHQKSGTMKNLFFKGLKIPMKESYYSHAVGPIHAGIIEPGHFRFAVQGEIVQHLTIRLGFQHRGILKELSQAKPSKSMSISEMISGDTSIGYSNLFSRLWENVLGIDVPKEVQLFRGLLLELERISIHIGDLGALAGDLGFYPLYGVCVTERGAGLGLMESWTGHRFGKGTVRPGGVYPNLRITPKEAKSAIFSLKEAFEKRIEPQIKRALSESTIRERLQNSGVVTKESIEKEGFVGPVARAASVSKDLRWMDPAYQDWEIINYFKEKDYLVGDAWARFYLRYLEIKQSLYYCLSICSELDWDKIWNTRPLNQESLDSMPIRDGVYFAALEGWRGSLVVGLTVKDANRQFYVRDHWF